MIVFAFLAAVLSALANFYPKTYIPRFDPLLLSFLKNAYVGIILLLFFAKRSRREEIKELKKKDFFLLGAISLLGGAFAYSLFFLGLRATGNYTAGLIQKTLFIWVVMLAIFFLKERFSRYQFISFVLIVIGTFFIIPLRAPLAFSRGEWLIFAATLLWALDLVLIKKALETMSMFVVGLARYGVGAVWLLVLMILVNKTKLVIPWDLDGWLIIAGHGFFIFLYIYCLYASLFTEKVSLVSLILTLSMVVSLVIDIFYFRVKPSVKVIYSSALIAAAMAPILFGQIKPIKKAGGKPAF